MVTSEIYIDILAPRLRVWKYVTDITNLAKWQSGISGVTATNGMSEGSLLRLKSSRTGPKTEIELEITRNDGLSTLNARSRSGPVRFEIGYYLIEISVGTRVQFWNHISTPPLYRDAEVALQTVGEIRYRADLERLKVVLELSGPAKT